MKIEIKLKSDMGMIFSWFYILVTIYCMVLSYFAFGLNNQGLALLGWGFIGPYIILIISDFIGKIRIKIK